jgi:microcystin-dependent protein
MTEPFLGEIRVAAFNFAPKGWAFCNGQVLPISQNQALFALLGTTYGGNGQSTFALPNLQARVPVHVGGGFPQGQQAGEATHTLTIAELPAHTHQVSASSAQGDQPAPNQHVPAATSSAAFGTKNDVAMDPQAVSLAGQGQPHDNLPPYLVVNFVIALQGIFPSQN